MKKNIIFLIPVFLLLVSCQNSNKQAEPVQVAAGLLIVQKGTMPTGIIGGRLVLQTLAQEKNSIFAQGRKRETLAGTVVIRHHVNRLLVHPVYIVRMLLVAPNFFVNCLSHTE